MENFYKRQKYIKFAVNKFGLFQSPYKAFVGACKKLYTNMKSIYLILQNHSHPQKLTRRVKKYPWIPCVMFEFGFEVRVLRGITVDDRYDNLHLSAHYARCIKMFYLQWCDSFCSVTFQSITAQNCFRINRLLRATWWATTLVTSGLRPT